MQTIKSATGYNRLVPETKIERGLLEIAIKATLDHRELKTAGSEFEGEIKVLDSWDSEGRLACRATFVTGGEECHILDYTKSIEFAAWVEDQSSPVVVWETKIGDRVTSNVAPCLPMILAADLSANVF